VQLYSHAVYDSLVHLHAITWRVMLAYVTSFSPPWAITVQLSYWKHMIGQKQYAIAPNHNNWSPYSSRIPVWLWSHASMQSVYAAVHWSGDNKNGLPEQSWAHVNLSGDTIVRNKVPNHNAYITWRRHPIYTCRHACYEIGLPRAISASITLLNCTR
jgi:hypothetical protein